MNPSEDEVHEALFAAAEHGRSDVIKALLEHTTGYMNVRDIVHERTGETPLQMAIQNGKIDAVRVLLAAGFPLGEKVENIVDLKDLEKEKVATYSAYAIACEQQQPKMMNVFHQFFIQKVAEDDIDAVRRLLNAGIDVTIIGEDTSANSVYHWAAMCGSSETLAILLDTDPDKKLLNRPNSQGATPLSEAVRLDHYECVKILLANGAESSSVCSTSAKTIAQSERMQRLLSQHTKHPDQNQKFDSNIITKEEHVKQEVVISDVLNYATELEEKNLLIVQLKSTIERLVAELRDLKSLGREMSVLEYIRKLRKEKEWINYRLEDAMEQIKDQENQIEALKEHVRDLDLWRTNHLQRENIHISSIKPIVYERQINESPRKSYGEKSTSDSTDLSAKSRLYLPSRASDSARLVESASNTVWSKVFSSKWNAEIHDEIIITV